MLLEPGTKALIAHRRLFAEDQPRFFLGVVDHFESGIARMTGYSWTVDYMKGGIVRKRDRRTKLVSVASGTVLAYALPEHLEIEDVQIERADDGRIFLADLGSFKMDLTDRKLASC